MSDDRVMVGVSLERRSALSELDWKVVEMARADGPYSLNPDGLWASLLRKLFGIEIARGLASERLEALRRFSVRAWHWDLVRTKDMIALIDEGYSRKDALHILAHVATHRGFTPSVQDGLLDIRSGLEGSFVPSRRPSSLVRALPVPQAPTLAQRRGQNRPVRENLAQTRMIGIAR